MANTDAAFGLRPFEGGGSGDYTGKTNYYYIPSSYATALYVGDPVIKTSTANTAEYKGHGIGSLPAINKAAAGDGNAITGVITGFLEDPDNLSKQYNPASTERIAIVNDDPNQVFEIQADGSISADQVGLNAVLIFTNAGSTVTGWSGVELDTSSDAPAADASNQLTILRIVSRADNEAATANTKVLVRVNNHTEAHGAIGI